MINLCHILVWRYVGAGRISARYSWRAWRATKPWFVLSVGRFAVIGSAGWSKGTWESEMIPPFTPAVLSSWFLEVRNVNVCNTCSPLCQDLSYIHIVSNLDNQRYSIRSDCFFLVIKALNSCLNAGLFYNLFLASSLHLRHHTTQNH